MKRSTWGQSSPGVRRTGPPCLCLLGLASLARTAAAFELAQRREKQALGLPRRIGHPAQGNFRPGRHVKDRHAAPVWYHLGREAGGLVVRVTALPANHDPAVEPLLYAIEADGRRIFYGTDTATLPEATWRAFHRLGLRFDVAILDHTFGPDEEGDDHLNARQVIAHAARLRAEGLLADGARLLATHLSPAGNPPHPELAAFAVQHGYEVAYDGLTV